MSEGTNTTNTIGLIEHYTMQGARTASGRRPAQRRFRECLAWNQSGEKAPLESFEPVMVRVDGVWKALYGGPLEVLQDAVGEARREEGVTA